MPTFLRHGTFAIFMSLLFDECFNFLPSYTKLILMCKGCEVNNTWSLNFEEGTDLASGYVLFPVLKKHNGHL